MIVVIGPGPRVGRVRNGNNGEEEKTRAAVDEGNGVDGGGWCAAAVAVEHSAVATAETAHRRPDRVNGQSN